MRPPDAPIANFDSRTALPPCAGSPAFDPLVVRMMLDLKPVRPGAVPARLLAGVGAGVAVSIVLVGIGPGYRPDMASASLSAMFWIKLAYALGVGALALWSVERLARPGGLALPRILWLLFPPATVVGLAAWQAADALARDRMHLMMGVTATVCPWWIIAFALPPLAGLVWAVRGLAPTRLAAAGAMVGLAAGGFGAGAYALHCRESAAPFLAIWYSLGVAACGAFGAALGPKVLRW